MDQKKTPGCAGALEADDGTRTHDLLQGNEAISDAFRGAGRGTE
jgi:hypothetical protein